MNKECVFRIARAREIYESALSSETFDAKRILFLNDMGLAMLYYSNAETVAFYVCTYYGRSKKRLNLHHLVSDSDCGRHVIRTRVQ